MSITQAHNGHAASHAERLQMKLDDKTVEAKTAHYPEQLREPVLWAASFCRDHCNRQVSLLQKKVSQFGHSTDYGYWHRIFTGKYFQPNPSTGLPGEQSADNFLEIIEAVREHQRNESRAGRPAFVETGTWRKIRDAITKIRPTYRCNKFGGIVGATGMQKSESYKHLRDITPHGQIAHIEAPAKGSMAQFVMDLARCYGESVHHNMIKMISFINQAVNPTRCIIVDNVQRLYKERAAGDQPIFNFLQKLQDDTGCTVILSWTPTFTEKLEIGREQGYFEQFIGRFGGWRKILVLPDYPQRDDVIPIANGFGLQESVKHSKYLEKICREEGRIRILFDELQDAKQLAGDEPLTISHIKAVRGEEEDAEK